MVSTYTLLSFGPYRVFLSFVFFFFYELSFVILLIRPYEPWIHRFISFQRKKNGSGKRAPSQLDVEAGGRVEPNVSFRPITVVIETSGGSSSRPVGHSLLLKQNENAGKIAEKSCTFYVVLGTPGINISTDTSAADRESPALPRQLRVCRVS